MKDGYFSGWSIIGAETINDINNVVWKNKDGLLSIWKTDSNWEYSGSAFIGAANSSDALQWETDFNQDFNDDSIIGTTYSDRETAGSTDLVIDTLGNAYASVNGTRNAITFLGNKIKDGFTPGWSIIGAETIDGINHVAWKNDADGLLSIWKTHSDWEYSGSAFIGPAKSGSVHPWEVFFDQDFDGDSIIGLRLGINNPQI